MKLINHVWNKCKFLLLNLILSIISAFYLICTFYQQCDLSVTVTKQISAIKEVERIYEKDKCL